MDLVLQGSTPWAGARPHRPKDRTQVSYTWNRGSSPRADARGTVASIGKAPLSKSGVWEFESLLSRREVSTVAFDGFGAGKVVKVYETEEARAQRLAADSEWMEAQRMAGAEKRIRFWNKCIKSVQGERDRSLVKPVLGQEEIHFIGEKDDSTYREPPKTETDWIRAENDALLKKYEVLRKRMEFWRCFALSGLGVGVGWILGDIVLFFW